MANPMYPHLSVCPPADGPPLYYVLWKTSGANDNNHFILVFHETGPHGQGWRLVLYENKSCGATATVICDELIDPKECSLEQLKASFKNLGDELHQLFSVRSKSFQAIRIALLAGTTLILRIDMSHDSTDESQPTVIDDSMRLVPVTIEMLVAADAAEVMDDEQ